MENSNVKENLEVLFEKFKNMIKVETVVGEAVQIGDTTLVPFVDVTFGFGTGTNHNTSGKNHECGGGGGGGMVAMIADTIMNYGSVTAAGGAGGSGRTSGAAGGTGIVFIKELGVM